MQTWIKQQINKTWDWNKQLTATALVSSLWVWDLWVLRNWFILASDLTTSICLFLPEPSNSKKKQHFSQKKHNNKCLIKGKEKSIENCELKETWERWEVEFGGGGECGGRLEKGRHWMNERRDRRDWDEETQRQRVSMKEKSI